MNIWNQIKDILKNESGQFEFLLPAAGSLISNLIGSHAAAPAAQAQGGVTQTQSDILNALLQMYKTQYAPQEQQMVSRMGGLMQQLPYEQIVGQTLGQLTSPYRIPDPIVARALMGVQQGTDRERAVALRDMERRGITGPAQAAAMQGIGEQGLQSKYGVLSNVMETEAGKQEQNQLRAFDIVNQLFGRGMQVAGAGRQMIPGIMGGLENLGGQYAGAAQAAMAPWQQLGASLGPAYGAYQQQQTISPYYQAMTNYYNQLAGGGGGGGMTMPWQPPSGELPMPVSGPSGQARPY